MLIDGGAEQLVQYRGHTAGRVDDRGDIHAVIQAGGPASRDALAGGRGEWLSRCHGDVSRLVSTCTGAWS